MTKPSSQQGIAILVSILLVGVLLSIVFVLSAIFIPKIKTAAETKNSISAAYAAESGLEWCLYVTRVDDTAAKPVMGIVDLIYTVDCAAVPVHAIGTYRGVTRAFEIF